MRAPGVGRGPPPGGGLKAPASSVWGGRVTAPRPRRPASPGARDSLFSILLQSGQKQLSASLPAHQRRVLISNKPWQRQAAGDPGRGGQSDVPMGDGCSAEGNCQEKLPAACGAARAGATSSSPAWGRALVLAPRSPMGGREVLLTPTSALRLAMCLVTCWMGDLEGTLSSGPQLHPGAKTGGRTDCRACLQQESSVCIFKCFQILDLTSNPLRRSQGRDMNLH